MADNLKQEVHIKKEGDGVEEKWERSTKDRTFVRSVLGKYGEIYKNLLNQPRVYKSKDIPYRAICGGLKMLPSDPIAGLPSEGVNFSLSIFLTT